jgi:hypothetical protein
MCRRIFPLSLLPIIALLTLTSCSGEQREQKAEDKAEPITASSLSAPFNESFAKLLNSYFEMKDAFVESDTMEVNAAAAGLLLSTDALKINDISGDSTGTIKETAQVFATTISNSVKALMAEKNIDDKRREFNMISDALWSLTRTVRYDMEKVYYQYCPMAFDNAGAYWLSRTSHINNPYFGEKMLTCGEVTDSLDYSKR